MRIRSLRRRIATFYALLLLGVVAAVAIVLTFQLRAILLDEARAKTDRVGGDIAAIVRGSALSAIGDALPIETELTATGSLDRWSGPTTFVEIDSAAGYPEGKSTNMGGAAFEEPAPPAGAVRYRIEHRPVLGDVLVREEFVRYPGVALFVLTGESLAIYDETLGRVRLLLGVVLAFAAVAVAVGSYAIAASATLPIQRLSAAMNEIRSDRLSRRLHWPQRHDELGSLANSFDAMLDRLEDGFARERQFISDASHELKTPLTVINANAQMLERWGDRDPTVLRESLRAIREESGSLAAMVNGMLLLAKAENGDDIPREPVALDAAVGEAVRAAGTRASEKGLALVWEPAASGVLIRGDGNLLRQLFANLIDNAVKFTERGEVRVRSAVANGRATVDVLDTGAGIDDDALERVFDRFYRTDASRNRAVAGTGLGLAIVRSIARVHDGTVEAARRPGGGTIFRVELPAFTAPS